MRLRRMNLGRIQSCTNQVRQEDPTNLNYISFLWATLVTLFGVLRVPEYSFKLEEH